ncbi:response regulator [Paenibacillus tarimensis]
MIGKAGLPFEVVHEAENGIEAMDWLRGQQADLILSDIRMPVMDGLALLREIKSKSCEADVVFVSGHDDFAYAQQALRYGAFDFLLKPVEAENLAECFQLWMDQYESRNMASDIPEKDEGGLSPVEQVIRYLDANPGADLTLSGAAAMVHLNSSYFCKLFKQMTNVNFRDYVIRSRMKEAVRLLENTSLRISEIAERVGYTELAYFSNTFKKATGQTPREYRKQQL